MRLPFIPLALALAVVGPAAANDIDPYQPRNLQLVDEGADVRVSLEIATYGEPDVVEVLRNGPCDPVLVATLGWHLGDPVEVVSSACLHIDLVDCDEEPGQGSESWHSSTQLTWIALRVAQSSP